jgi:DNA replication protein DnaC
MKTNQLKETMTNKQAYKYEEIKSHFEDFINENGEDWVKEHKEDLHHEIFNTDYYIIGRFQATKWLGDQVFNVINIIKEYENDNFGEVNTDFSEVEKVVNMYVYIIGEEIVSEYLEKLEEKKVA